MNIEKSVEMIRTTRIADIPNKSVFYDVRVTGLLVGITNHGNTNYILHLVDFSKKHPESPHNHSSLAFESQDKYFGDDANYDYVLDITLFPEHFEEIDQQCKIYLGFDLRQYVSGMSYDSFLLHKKGIFISGVIRARQKNEYKDLIFSDRSLNGPIEGRKPKVMAVSSRDKTVRWLFDLDPNIARIQTEMIKIFDRQFFENNISNFEKTLCAEACTQIVNHFNDNTQSIPSFADTASNFLELRAEDLVSDFSEDEDPITNHNEPESQFEPDKDLQSFTTNQLGGGTQRPWHAIVDSSRPDSQKPLAVNDNSIIGDISDAESSDGEVNNALKRRRVQANTKSSSSTSVELERANSKADFDTPNFNTLSDLDKVSITQSMIPYYVYAQFSSCLNTSYRPLIYNLRQDDIKPHITGLEFSLEDKNKVAKIIVVTVNDVPRFLSLSESEINSNELPKILKRKIVEIVTSNKFCGILIRRFNQPLNGAYSSSIASWRWVFTDSF